MSKSFASTNVAATTGIIHEVRKFHWMIKFYYNQLIMEFLTLIQCIARYLSMVMKTVLFGVSVHRVRLLDLTFIKPCVSKGVVYFDTKDKICLDKMQSEIHVEKGE